MLISHKWGAMPENSYPATIEESKALNKRIGLLNNNSTTIILIRLIVFYQAM